MMGRNRANPFWTTYQTNNNVNQLMNTQNAEANWAGGGQVTVGYGCSCGLLSATGHRLHLLGPRPDDGLLQHHRSRTTT